VVGAFGFFLGDGLSWSLPKGSLIVEKLLPPAPPRFSEISPVPDPPHSRGFSSRTCTVPYLGSHSRSMTLLGTLSEEPNYPVLMARPRLANTVFGPPSLIGEIRFLSCSSPTPPATPGRSPFSLRNHHTCWSPAHVRFYSPSPLPLPVGYRIRVFLISAMARSFLSM